MLRRRSLALGLAVAIVASGVALPAAPAGARPRSGQGTAEPGFQRPRAGRATVDPRIERALLRAPAARRIGVIVYLRSQADLSTIRAGSRAMRTRTILGRLQATASAAQPGLLAQLDQMRRGGQASGVRSLWVIDAVAVRATRSAIAALALRADVLGISLDAQVVVPAGAQSSPIAEPNLDVVGAPTLWNMGFTGQGVVVASMDTGVDVSHPDLSGSWRGGTDSWYDPSGQHPTTPVDVAGHGTSTMGVMVGGAAGGSSIGVAPGATWIATKIFNDQGVATLSGIHAAFQWLLDPDGNASTPDAPDVALGSWTFANPGCDLTFEPDLEALRAAGILPVFAAGNGGPSAASSFSPGNNPAAISVGSTDNSDVVANDSSRGPSTCGGRTRSFPDLVAPGVSIKTTDLFGQYTHVSGTSVAAPHVAAALALLRGAFPTASDTDLETAVLSSAVDLGAAGPDDIYGNGRLDVAAAYSWLRSHTVPPPELLSIKASGKHTLGSLTGVQKKDVVAFDGTDYTMVFDGSDVGLGAVRLDAVARLSANSLLLSFATPVTVPGLGAVDDSDVVRFDATSLGSTTAGTFSMWFHGADVGLTTDGEDVDALGLLPDGRVLLSTLGWASVPGRPGIHREDVVAFTPTSLGSTTAGTFAFYLDGSDVGLTTLTENVDAVDVGADGHVALSTTGGFSVPGLAGTGDDVFECVPSSLGSNSACTYSPALVLNGSASGLAGLGVDGFHR